MANEAKGAAVAQGGAQLYTGETRRRIGSDAFSDSRVVSRDIPRDSVFKRFEFRAVGYFSVTYASGSPIASQLGISQILPRLDVIANGERTIKSIDTHLQERQNLLNNGVMAERAYSTSASAPTTLLALTETPFQPLFAYPATTQYVLINSGFVVNFEHPFAYELGKSATLFDTRNLSSCEIRYNFGALTAIQETGGSVSVTYGDTNLNFISNAVEAPSVPRDQKFLDYKQSVRRFQISGEVRDLLLDLPRGNLISGIHMFVRNGDTNRRPSDIAIKDMTLLVNGQRILAKLGSFLELQQNGRLRYGINAAKGTASSGMTHALQGYCYLSLVRDGDLRTALDTSIQAGVDNLQLSVTSAATSGTDAATYTNPVEVSLMIDELVRI